MDRVVGCISSGICSKSYRSVVSRDTVLSSFKINGLDYYIVKCCSMFYIEVKQEKLINRRHHF